MSFSESLGRIATNCSLSPDAEALVFGNDSHSYAQLGAAIQGMIELLENRLHPDENFVAVYATHEFETYAGILAILLSGRAYVPLNPKSPAVRNATCVQQARVRTLLCSKRSEGVEHLSQKVGDSLKVLETQGTTSTSTLDYSRQDADDTPAYLLFTSGSTGTPKGVPIHHGQLVEFFRAVNTGLDLSFSSRDRFLQMFDLTFDLSVFSFLTPLILGATCCVVPDSGVGFLKIAQTLQKEQITVALMVPSVLMFLERYFNEISVPALRASLFCGEALPARTAFSWRSCAPNARILNVYGPTEATIFCSSFELPVTEDPLSQHQGVVSIGRPMPGTRFRVVDESLGDVPIGQSGELVILGGQITTGYWYDESKTSHAFVKLPDGERGYRTGDLAFTNAGLFYYGGRLDHQLKVDGYRVEVGEIEHHARQLAGVSDAAVVGVSGKDGRTQLVLFLMMPAEQVAASEIKNRLAATLPAYMVPARVCFLEAFPLNSNGKVDRRELAAKVPPK